MNSAGSLKWPFNLFSTKTQTVLKRFYLLILILPAIIALAGCTTQKRKGDMSLLGKAYHNTTAHYNGYFNADELMQASVLTLEGQHQDNYSKLLPMYKYIAADNPQAVAGDLDVAMKKVTVVVNLHRRSDWTDDCYLLVGKAQFYKQDYETAEETLRFSADEFNPSKVKKKKSTKAGSSSKASSKSKSSSKKKSEASSSDDSGEEKLSAKEQAKKRKEYNKQIKKKKKSSSGSKKKTPAKKPTTTKEEEKPVEKAEEPTPAPAEAGLISLTDSGTSGSKADPDGYFMKHRPAYQEIQLWLARTLIERDKYDEAFRMLNQLEEDSKTFSDVRREASAAKAYYYIKRKMPSQAVVQLEKAAELADKRADKARYTFIAAQLHQQLGNAESAYAAFERVLKFNPVYEMEFSSKLNMAQNSYRAGKGTAEEAVRNLEKLLKDSKNLEFQDQIYYALAEIALKEGNRDQALAYLAQSLKNSRQNRSQKAEAYLTMARLFYENEDYLPAKAYYDSTLQVLATNDERYDEVTKFSNNLTDIARHLQTIQLQDSLLRISELSEKEKRELALRIKEEQEAAQRKAMAGQTTGKEIPGKAGSKNLPGNVVAATQSGQRPALQKESSFFAYDDRAVKRGQREFDRRWGVRTLEDDWRRANRRTTVETEEIAASEEVASAGSLTDEDLKRLLGNVPVTQGDKDEANRLIREAMFSLGTLYRDRLKNYDKAVESLEKLNERYPGNNYELDSWYFLYLTYTDMGNSAKAQVYFDKIVGKYPTSNYAKILKDPNFAAKYLDEERRQALQYDEIYSLFSTGNYRDAYDRSRNTMESLLGKHPLKPKYALLMAMCSGNLQGKDAYISELQRVVAMYPESEEQKRAKEILRLLGATGAALPGKEKEETSGYKPEADDAHYIIIVFKDEKVDLNAAKIKVSDFNGKYYKLDNLRIQNIFLGEGSKTPVLLLRRTKNQADAMKYLDTVYKNRKDFLDSGTMAHDLMIISQNNYRLLLSNKDLAAYKTFFDATY